MLIEELHIIKGNAKYKLDLGKQSNITLKYVSNIFNDLSKIAASYSYSFKLPFTQNNRRIMDMAEDVRHDSNIVGKAYSAEFIVNGVPLFRNGNLYLLKVASDSYECTFTWNSVSGLKKISTNDISINELGNHIENYDYEYEKDGVKERDRLYYMGRFTKYAFFIIDRNTQPIGTLHKPGVNPYIKAFIYSDHNSINYESQVSSNGVPCFYEIPWDERTNLLFFKDGGLAKRGIRTSEQNDQDYRDKDWFDFYGRYTKTYITSSCLPPPVVPLPYLMRVISEYYGIAITIEDELFNKLCIPLINVECSEGVYKQNYISFCLEQPSSKSLATYIKDFKKTSNGTFNNFVVDSTTAYRTDSYKDKPALIMINQTLRDGSEGVVDFTTNYIRLRLVFDGYLEVYIPGVGNGDEDEVEPTIEVQTLKRGNSQGGGNWYTIATLKGEFVGRQGFGQGSDVSNYPCMYRFEFRESEGHENLESDIIYSDKLNIYLRFELGNKGEAVNVRTIMGNLKMYVKHDIISDERYINVFQNLPDISCMELLKSIGYILGMYPVPTADGGIEFKKYSSIEDNIKANKIVDWSNRVLSDDCEDSSIDFMVTSLSSSYARKNYFLMKNDEINGEGMEIPNKKGEDAFRHSYGKIEIEGANLNEQATVFQLPFYGAFVANGKKPSVQTYNNISLWTTDNGRVYSIKEAKPIIATIEPLATKVITLKSTTNGPAISKETDGELYCDIKTWQFPENMEDDERYKMMCRILKNPKIIEMKMALTELDLFNLDITLPVYIDKLNSLFAVVSIERQSDGISKVQLIKIPN